ncbi:MAG: tripartite tricarboxylate transporter TctB family protein [Oscillospiraceae bacterium]|jgi:putative tricarboxylic transport membrane protein
MAELLRINVVHSTQHKIFPTISIGILVLLGAIILLVEGRAKVAAGKPIFSKPKSIFIENYDKIKFWGCLGMMVAYFSLLDVIGFTVTSIVFVYLFNTLFGGLDRLKNKKYHLNSLIISLISVVSISLLFGTIFDITLPDGICTIWIKSLGITIF